MKTFISLILLCNTFLAGLAQNFHINISVGAANYHGDMQSKRYTFNQAKPAFGLGLSYEVSDKFFIRTGLIVAKVSGDDKLNPQTQIRNLNFTSSVYEAHIAAEYYLLNPSEYSLAPYLFGGVAVYHFNPYTTDTSGNKFFLQQLSTEGQGFYQNRKPYNLNQFAIPFGVGAKLALTENIHVSIEVGARKLFTDYLDDVSTTYVDPNLLLANKGPKTLELAYRENELKNTPPYPTGDNRGGQKYKDWYYFTMFTTSFRIGGDKKNSLRSRVGCPTRI